MANTQQMINTVTKVQIRSLSSQTVLSLSHSFSLSLRKQLQNQLCVLAASKSCVGTAWGYLSAMLAILTHKAFKDVTALVIFQFF